MPMPQQKPHNSKQDYSTPDELIIAIKNSLKIREFTVDLAADKFNTKAAFFYTEEDNSLIQDWSQWGPEQWLWLNPPFFHIEPWTKKAAEESNLGCNIAMLVPASVGSNWWKNWVEPYAYQVFLNGRLCFIPDWKEQGFKSKPLYPKDCAILIYTPWGFTGHEIWTWSEGVEGMSL